MTTRRLGGTPGEFDAAQARAKAAAAYDRSFDPAGTGRQLAALWSAGDRTHRLAAITAPTLVLHGSQDRIVDPSGGRATAAAIPDARLIVIEGMAHDLPQAHISTVVAELSHHFAKAAGPTGPARDRA